MIVVVLILLGLCTGSFVNALVWRLHEQARGAKKRKNVISTKVERSINAKKDSSTSLGITSTDLSILKGRSMCPNCKHALASKDLVPVLSWLSLGGKCRYCRKKIAAQYPIVELATAALFVASYLWWPESVTDVQTFIFGLWLIFCIGLMALVVYDLRWLILPNRVIYPMSGLAGLLAATKIIIDDQPLLALANTALAVAVGGGIFYLLFQVSKGKWIGGGDVRLGWLLGLVVGAPGRSLLFIFIASMLGTLVSLPLLATKRLKRASVIPFGPFLIAGLIITQLFGQRIIDWYMHLVSLG